MLQKIKGFLDFQFLPKDALFVLIIILTALSSFGLGVLSEREMKEEPVRLYSESKILFEENTKTDSSNSLGASVIEQSSLGEGRVVASKNSDKYHLPWCSGAQRIKEENKVWFNSREEAEKAGLTAASNCPGLQ